MTASNIQNRSRLARAIQHDLMIVAVVCCLVAVSLLVSSHVASAAKAHTSTTLSLPTGAISSDITASACNGTNCYGVGSYNTASTGPVPLLVIVDNGVETNSVAPVSVAGTGQFTDVVCPSASWCVAAGAYTTSGAYGSSAFVSFGTPGSTWTTKFIPNELDQQPAGLGYVGVSCWAAGHCLIMTQFSTVLSSPGRSSSIETLTGSTISKPLTLPALSGKSNPPEVIIGGVDCYGTAKCLIAVASATSNNSVKNYSLVYDAGSFVAIQLINSQGGLAPNMVSCATASTCLISEGGNAFWVGSPQPVTKASRWSLVVFNLPANLVINGDSQSQSLDCVSSSTCILGGMYQISPNMSVNETTYALFDLLYEPGSSSPTATELLLPLTVGDLYGTMIVSCTETGDCVMFGGDDGNENLFLTDLPPGAVQAATTKQTSDTTATVSWTPPIDTGGGISEYKVQWLRSGSTVWNTEPPTTATSVAISGLSPLHTYEFKVTCIATSDLVSAPTKFSLVTYKSASAPRSVKATPGPKSIVVSWVVPANLGGSALKGYVLSASWSDGTKQVTVGVTTKASILGLKAGHAVHVRVAAITSAGAGAKSAAVSATPKP
jgi:hypothetical protein